MRVPVTRYTSPAWAAAEAELLWPACWLMAAPVQTVPMGGWRSAQLGPVEVVLWRTAEGVAAYDNVCPHRASPLVAGCGRGARLTCPYHGWAFAADGEVAHVPARADFDEAPAGLRALRVEVFAGLVWVCRGAAAPSLTEWLGAAAGWLAEVGVASLSVGSEVHVPLACDWKASADMHAEAYHVPVLHQDQLTAGPIEVDVELADPHGRLRLPAMGTQLLQVFPNLQVNAHPAGALLFRHDPSRDGPGRCMFTQWVLQPDAAAAPPARQGTIDDAAFGPVTSADLRQAERIQRGMRGGQLDEIQLGAGEALLAQRHRALLALGIRDE